MRWTKENARSLMNKWSEEKSPLYISFESEEVDFEALGHIVVLSPDKFKFIWAEEGVWGSGRFTVSFEEVDVFMYSESSDAPLPEREILVERYLSVLAAVLASGARFFVYELWSEQDFISDS